MTAVMRLSYGDTLPLRLCEQNNTDPHQPVCIGLFQGDKFTHKTFGANRRADAIREAKRIRARGVGARLVWMNVGPWCSDLWTQDLGRRLEIHPDDHYGSLELETLESAPPGVVRRPGSR